MNKPIDKLNMNAPPPKKKNNKQTNKQNKNKNKNRIVVCWLLNVPATCECISGTDLHRQFYVLPH